MKKIGLDVGSTTIKCVVLDENNQILYSDYKRHYSHIKDNIITKLQELIDLKWIDEECYLAISGSAGMGLAEGVGIPFVQEVYATRIAANTLIPGTDCIIELGGEDAKILFLTDGMEVRMNGSCAGGTGAFIDQMATLLNVDITEINGLALNHQKLYAIASRCGVFAKSDIQPLLNQGASKSDIAASIFNAVVNQTIGGLAQGREIKGNVAYLGGPLTFLSELKASFDSALNVQGICPKNSLYYVAIGAALCAKEKIQIKEKLKDLQSYINLATYAYNQPLFANETELKEFRCRHAKAHIDSLPLEEYTGKLYLGIDSGSTTLKFVLIDEDEQIRFEKYQPNKGNPVEVIHNIFTELYNKYPNLNIAGSASTGYGEELAKNAFNLDAGLVETMAHFRAAAKFKPDVDFIIDIGGQDIKCFKIENNAIANIFLNEACSSGCGSFLQTFANALGYKIEDFAKLGLMADKPVDLGSRCTVFMNSSVKQAQKDGATIENISAGLSISVVKNALYKVIRATTSAQLGKNIVVQGGTFHNEAVLRAFEKELNLNVVCPNISGLMGAYGAALYAKSLKLEHSKTITKEELKGFEHKVQNFTCKGCNNNCLLSLNTFGSNQNKFISGNRCEKPLAKKITNNNSNLYEYIRNKLMSYKPIPGKRGKLGIPLILNMYELWPFWYTFFSNLGFEVYNSGFSNEKLYTLGQHTIPSDTVCYPAKLVHGHIAKLQQDELDTIFYPCMSYNIDEKKGDNHFNCPIVAYYPQTIENNVKDVQDIKFIHPFIGIHDKDIFEQKMREHLKDYNISKKEIHKASSLAYEAYETYLADLRKQADQIISTARLNQKQIIVLAGRPYHVDPQVNHGIDKLINGFDVAVVTEESISHLVPKFKVGVLNQWTYHARLYAAAKYCTTQKDMNLVQLVSFGCGLDAVTTDECKTILENHNKIYTQIKIDEITNLGAVKIRLRSLFAALKQKEEN
ncbi:MAG: acyl-CoA dehydratase activase [Roseburia sp.]|nr:acyl-CoA dehydratase activase [Anaeroplasma bactoclasticum]MCM1195677.1 acyl-CoA dehydratase activase [Roseburia sp.]MCM1556134.1 acyl-CoA dehydratase activase [Anaeroplasma bactoclasticum]